jgi:hypothetical protein
MDVDNDNLPRWWVVLALVILFLLAYALTAPVVPWW